MRAWLQQLTRPEDDLLWIWVAIVAGYAIVGLAVGLRARHRAHVPAREAPAASEDE